MKKEIQHLLRALDWRFLPTLADWVVEEAIRIQQIPAPTFHEIARAQYVASRFREFHLEDVLIDEMDNVCGRLAGENGQLPALLLVAHTDTVFDQQTDLTIRREGDCIYGPGLGDNSLGVSGLLGVIKAIREQNWRFDSDIWFLATSGEEGLGDLRGMRHAFTRLRHKIGCVINLEGLAFGHIYHAGIAVHRLHIRAQTGGGHSWLHFGRPSAVHGILQLGARITQLPVPQSPRTTYNVGMIDGGQTINAIATNASLWLDLRSESRDELEKLIEHVHALVKSLSSSDLHFSIEVVGDRPSGFTLPDHPLVKGAMSALEAIGVRGTLETGSTDGNVSLAYGCPTVTIGISRGGNAHRLDEFIETSPVLLGMKQLLLLLLAVAKYRKIS